MFCYTRKSSCVVDQPRFSTPESRRTFLEDSKNPRPWAPHLLGCCVLAVHPIRHGVGRCDRHHHISLLERTHVPPPRKVLSSHPQITIHPDLAPGLLDDVSMTKPYLREFRDEVLRHAGVDLSQVKLPSKRLTREESPLPVRDQRTLSHRIVGYSSNSRIGAQLAVDDVAATESEHHAAG